MNEASPGNFLKDQRTAKLAAAHHAKMAYGIKDIEVARWVIGQGFSLYHARAISNTGFAIASSPMSIVVSIPGSDDLMDWALNLSGWIRFGWKGVYPKGARVGRGWLKQAKKIAPFAASDIREAKKKFPHAHVYLCGHSAGAAIVSALLPYLREQGIFVAGTFLFGSPRPGNARFSQFLRGCLVSSGSCGPVLFTCNTYTQPDGSVEIDTVASVPSKLFGARHAGMLSAITEDGRFIYGDEFRALEKSSVSSVWRALKRIRKTAGTHSMGETIKRLRINPR